MQKAFALIMAGGASENLSVLTETRAEPALPFAGKFRLIDFPLSNCVNSDIYNVGVMTQYRPRSLNMHIGTGKPWDLDLANGGVHLLQPYQGGPYGDWQKGTADAVRRNLEFVGQQSEEHVLILAGDHIYLMDYRPMIAQHVQHNADLTVAVRRVSMHETHRFGIVSVDPEDRVVRFQEKPKRSRETLASMGIYVFKKSFLVELLENGDYVDFGRHLLPAVLEQGRPVFAYHFFGYWEDVGTVQSYWQANMSLLAENPALNLYDQDWVVHTRSEERAPVRIGPNAHVEGNLFSNGCRIDGIVERSVLSPGVFVEEGAVVRDSIVFNDAVIRSGAVVDRCVVDKKSVVGTDAHVGYGDDNTPNKQMPERLNTGLTLIGRASVVPERIVIGRNVAVHANTGPEAFAKNKKKIASGASVGVDLR